MCDVEFVSIIPMHRAITLIRHRKPFQGMPPVPGMECCTVVVAGVIIALAAVTA